MAHFGPFSHELDLSLIQNNPAMGDYWTVSSGIANHTGHTCRECRQTIYVNTPIYVRDGRKIRLFYHEGCFSGDSDPRTQSQSSIQKWGEDGLGSKAPPGKGYGKWWTTTYGYEGGLQNGRALPLIREKIQNGKTASTTQHEKQDFKNPNEKRRSGSVVMMSQWLKNGGRRSSSSSSSESSILGNGFPRRYSLPNSLSALELMTKDSEDRSKRHSARKQKAVAEEGQSSGG